MAILSTLVESVSTVADWNNQQMLYCVQMNMGARIEKRLQELGWKQVDLLVRVPDLEAGTLSAIIKRDSRNSTYAGAIAEALGVTLEWLLYGDLKTITGTHSVSYVLDANTEPGPNLAKDVPLISWVRAGEFCSSPDLLQPGDAECWIPSVRKAGPHTYALRVVGDSMVNPYPYGPSYRPGSIIFVDPEHPITNGCRVVARLHDSDEATFKTYTEDGGQRFLKPLNPQYPTITMDDNMRICGVVIGSWNDD